MTRATATRGEAPAADSELRERVMYSMLRSVVSLAHGFELPLRMLVDWLQMAYFHELRAGGGKLQEIASVLGVSISKAALLSKRLKTNFMRVDERVGLPRRIEFVLWAAPLTRLRLGQALANVDPKQIDRALAALLREGRVRRETQGRLEVYARTKTNSRLVTGDLEARLDALDNLLHNVRRTVHARFVARDDSAFARTISFRVRREDLGELRRLYEQHVWSRIQEIEARAKGDPEALAMDLSVLWAQEQSE